MQNQQSVSIVIPVYNEADQLGSCLQAIAAQTVAPLEVIVVDNNSTDNTIAIAQEFCFVRVLKEPKQGVVHARNRGFDAAKGAIIGRIDADSVLASDWVCTTQRIFSETHVDAVSGSMTYYAAPWSGFFNAVDLAFRTYLAWALGPEVALQGANLALRKTVWEASKATVCTRGGMHEDFDMSIHVREHGFSTCFTPSLRASVAFRQAAGSWRQFTRYALLNPGTYAQHKRFRCVVMYPVVLLAIIVYPLLHILYMGYDETLDSFSWVKLLSNTAPSRVNPATFVE